VQLDQQDFYVSDLEKRITEISRSHVYASMVNRLRCFKGVDTVAAMIILSETSDFSRFPHARKLMGFLGLAVAEYSSGPKRRLTHLTKTGNTHLRRLLVEIALKAQIRLHKRYVYLIFKDKTHNEAIAAMAREFCGFLWKMCTLPNSQKELAA